MRGPGVTIEPQAAPAVAPVPDIEDLIPEAKARRKKRWRVEIALLAVACMIVGLVLASGARTVGPAHSTPTNSLPVVVTSAPGCAAQAIDVAYEGRLVGAGSWNYLFTLRNASDHACSLAGFPSVRFLSSTGSTISVPIDDSKGECGRFGCGIGGLRNRGALPRALLAAHTGTASFFLEGVDVSTWKAPAPHPTACETVPRVEVALPHSSVWRAITNWRSGMDTLYPCGDVAVLPLVPGKSGTFPGVPLSTVGMG